jgi:hypothetical protein
MWNPLIVPQEFAVIPADVPDTPTAREREALRSLAEKARAIADLHAELRGLTVFELLVAAYERDPTAPRRQENHEN